MKSMTKSGSLELAFKRNHSSFVKERLSKRHLKKNPPYLSECEVTFVYDGETLSESQKVARCRILLTHFDYYSGKGRRSVSSLKLSEFVLERAYSTEQKRFLYETLLDRLLELSEEMSLDKFSVETKSSVMVDAALDKGLSVSRIHGYRLSPMTVKWERGKEAKSPSNASEGDVA
jgi:hypothetical protein